MNEPTLPEFPNLTSLEPHHQAAINDFIKGHYPYSDFNFVSLWSWDHERRLKLSRLNDNLVIRFQDYSDPNDFFYSFFGTSQTDETAAALLDHSRAEGKPTLRLIPEVVIANLKQPSRFTITEDRDSFDYIIAARGTAQSGEHIPKKREIERFMKQHGHELEVTELDIKASDTPDKLLAVFDQWRQALSSDGHFNPSEQAALKKLLDHRQAISTSKLHIVGLYMGGELSAFCIAEVLEDGFAMGHFAKTNKKFPRMGAALDHFTAQSLVKKGVTHINHEQDLGLEGLRQSKMSKQPVYFLKKYTISAK